MTEVPERLITDLDARMFFQGAVQSALQNQQINVCDETVVYLGNLLTYFICAERLFDQTPDGVLLRPLACHYQDAIEARSINDRAIALRRLGDISLFISGLFAQSLTRSVVDIDYYIAMGGNAYACLSDSNYRPGARALKQVYSELSGKFLEMTDILSEVGEVSNLGTNHDVLRLYEMWLKSGSLRAAAKLKQAGIHPFKTGLRRH
jgi:hypothetical protein